MPNADSQSVLNANFNDFDSEYPTVKPGLYEAQIVDVVHQNIETSNGEQEVLDINLKLTHADDPENENSTGLSHTDRYFLETLRENDVRRWSRALLSAGQSEPIEGTVRQVIDQLPTLLVDQMVKVRMGKRKPKNSDREFPKVSDYIPAE